ncbi:MAG: NAD(P)/FAD-dependent oxidoreductase [Chitinophagaceae bacterium]|nr:MAG: NAD(P)/FAD-dependent oxidoreductase [Chitinophagaceae bacterium]
MSSTPNIAPGSNGNTYDVLIIGAGLSGIGTAYWLQEKCPQKSFTILEARHTLGGTWDLFRYPGIRSDSDMFTFGFRFRPWREPQSLSKGDAILDYLRETAEAAGIDKRIRYGYRVRRAAWSSEEAHWTVDVEGPDGPVQLRAGFLCLCTGYYDFNEAHRPRFEGEAAFRGPLVLPQFWPQDLDYSGKRIVVVGSGATAVTLVPAMAQQAAHVTMLQRSPTYIMSLPNRNKLFMRLRKWLPDTAAYRITRWRNLLLSIASFRAARSFPGFVKKLVVKSAAKQLAPGFEVEKHFSPKYNPWDQRFCVVPDGDLFRAIRSGKAGVVTDEIARFSENGIVLQSGDELRADIIVLATGLNLRLLGGAEIFVDERKVEPNASMIYKGMMVSDVPNLSLAFGYTNASWTLKTDLTANYVCRLLNYMDRKGYRVVVPQRQAGVAPRPFLDFQSGYIQRAGGILPQQGHRRPWRVYQNYLMDMLTTRFGRINDGVLRFSCKKKTS